VVFLSLSVPGGKYIVREMYSESRAIYFSSVGLSFLFLFSFFSFSYLSFIPPCSGADSFFLLPYSGADSFFLLPYSGADSFFLFLFNSPTAERIHSISFFSKPKQLKGKIL